MNLPMKGKAPQTWGETCDGQKGRGERGMDGV